jgi:TonB family protein
MPALRVAHYEPLRYPPLALQTHIVGAVRLHVVVDKTGAVAKVAPLSGHPLLAAAMKDNISGWKFEPTSQDETKFDLTYEFVILEGMPPACRGNGCNPPQHSNRKHASPNDIPRLAVPILV